MSVEINQVYDQVLAFWREQNLKPEMSVVVGVSGGVDSLVLLHVLHKLQDELSLSLHAATLNHGLRGEAGAEDAAFVADFARSLDIPVTQGHIDVPSLMEADQLNLEEAARQARYSFLLATAVDVGANYIAVGHNHDDQAETVLMHIIRGTGLHGLRGMLPAAPLTDYHLLDDEAYLNLMPEDYLLIRPLLETPRSLIRAYADEYDITPREDPTNQDLTRFRNTLRHDVLPRLAELNPNIKTVLNRTADVVQAEVEVLDSRIESIAAWLLDWAETKPGDGFQMGGEVVYVDRKAYREQLLGIQRGIVRKIIFDLSPETRDFSYDMTETVRQHILEGGTGTRLDLPDGLHLTIGYDEAMIGYGGEPFYPRHLPSLKPGQFVALDQDGQGYITKDQRLITYWVVEGMSQDLYPTDPLECTLAIPEDASLALRTRQPGDRFQPFGMSGQSQKLSDTFTNLKVPAYYRDQVPLLIINDEIAWFVVPTAVGPVGRIAEPYAVQPNSKSVLRLRWELGPATDAASPGPGMGLL